MSADTQSVTPRLDVFSRAGLATRRTRHIVAAAVGLALVAAGVHAQGFTLTVDGLNMTLTWQTQFPEHGANYDFEAQKREGGRWVFSAELRRVNLKRPPSYTVEWADADPGEYRVRVRAKNKTITVVPWQYFTLQGPPPPPAECVEDGRYMQGSVGRPKRTHKGGPRQYGYTSCLHDGRFKVTATDLNDDPAPVSHRIRSASGTEDATVLFKLDGDKLLYVNVASYCHLADQGFEHYVVDVDTYGERATFEVTIEDLEGGTTKVYRSADSADENLDMQAFRCVP